MTKVQSDDSCPKNNTQFLSLSYCGLSDIGPTRPNNEDAWIALPEIGFFALADGVGGSKGGAVAAEEGVTHLSKSMQKIATFPLLTESKLREALRDAIERANQWVYQMGCSSELFSGMGSTLCCLYCTQEIIVYAHLGDSRIYRIRQGECQQLTLDHSYYAKWATLYKGDKELSSYPYKHVITKALGMQGKVHPEIASSSPQVNDLYLLCTDGLFNALSHEEMTQILNQPRSLEEKATQLLQQAKANSRDNVTLLAVHCGLSKGL